jgi:hypothetical protein
LGSTSSASVKRKTETRRAQTLKTRAEGAEGGEGAEGKDGAEGKEGRDELLPHPPSMADGREDGGEDDRKTEILEIKI